jgi:hypothetical protein
MCARVFLGRSPPPRNAVRRLTGICVFIEKTSSRDRALPQLLVNLRPKDHSLLGTLLCQIAAYSAQRKFRLERSACPGNEPGDARVNNRIESDSFTNPFTNFLDGVIGKSRDIKIFRDVARVRRCGERSGATLQRPG